MLLWPVEEYWLDRCARWSDAACLVRWPCACTSWGDSVVRPVVSYSQPAGRPARRHVVLGLRRRRVENSGGELLKTGCRAPAGSVCLGLKCGAALCCAPCQLSPVVGVLTTCSECGRPCPPHLHHAPSSLPKTWACSVLWSGLVAA
jgi:hypothetical protein